MSRRQSKNQRSRLVQRYNLTYQHRLGISFCISLGLVGGLAVMTRQNPPVIQSWQEQSCGTVVTTGNLGRLVTSEQKMPILSSTPSQVAEVIVAQGVARSGPSEDDSRLTPLPKGTRAKVTAKTTGKEGEWLRLDYGGWINSQETRILASATLPHSRISNIYCRPLSGKTEVVLPLQVPVPVSVQQSQGQLTLTLYNTSAKTGRIHLEHNPVISHLVWQQLTPGQVKYTFNLKQKQQWGYQLRYEGTSLILSLRHPPINKLVSFLSSEGEQPLAGIKILLDPGHGGTDTGAIGVNGYAEKDVTLNLAKLLREYLMQRGATVYLTREEDKYLSREARVAMIQQLEPAIALSIHYNSLGEDEADQATEVQGIGMFWYHPQATGLAKFLHNYLVTKLQRPSYGVFWQNLALARPTAAPSVLMELGFLSHPTEAEWIVNLEEQQQLAIALTEGITEWFRSVK